METIYRKVAVSERMPPPMTDILIKYRWNNYFEPYHYFDDLHCKDEMLNEVTHWIEEIPSPTVQLKSDNEKLLEALDNSRKVIEWYMENTMPESDNHTDFFNIGMNQRSEIESLIQKMKKCQENTPDNTSKKSPKLTKNTTAEKNEKQSNSQ